MIDVLIGLQWGDEGKGKIVDYLASNYDIIARFQGGPNAGHTLYINGEKMVLHTIPSGIFHDHCLNLIGNGVVIDPVTLKKEIEKVEAKKPSASSRLFISNKATLILPTHRALDAASELAKGKEKIGSTLKGIGPAYMDKTGRNSLRMGDILSSDFKIKYKALVAKHILILNQYAEKIEWEQWENDFFEAIEYLKKLQIVSGEYWLNDHLLNGKKVLAEGAQGSMLDVDFGTYPFVTSSSTISAGVCSGLGISPSKVGTVIGITKAYCTRVGSGPFPTELLDDMGDELRKIGNEFGATTGRPRRCGWIDLVALKYAVMLSGVSQLVITKADIIDHFKTINLAVAYKINGLETTQFPFEVCNEIIEPVYKTLSGWSKPIQSCKNKIDLPEEFLNYCSFLEDYLNCKIAYISNGTGRNDLLSLN